MNDRNKAYRKIIHLNFPPEHAGNPVMCHLVRRYDITFNILKARISPRREGYLTLQIEGAEESWREAMGYLNEQGIKVDYAAQRISRDEEACMHCGMCTAICPAGALYNERENRRVGFDAEQCTACGLCTTVCPVRAMQVDVEVD